MIHPSQSRNGRESKKPQEFVILSQVLKLLILFLESVKLSLSSKYASQCFPHLHFCHKLVGIQNLVHYFTITGL